MSSLKRFDGELTIDHRASPGLTPEEARAFGMPEVPLSEGREVSLATVQCNHCGGVWLVNTYRTRERHYCKWCDHYLCDLCAATSALPDYVHRTIAELTDLITSGKYTFAPGCSTTRPILIPTSRKEV
jgi:hypothetical protein